MNGYRPEDYLSTAGEYEAGLALRVHEDELSLSGLYVAMVSSPRRELVTRWPVKLTALRQPDNDTATVGLTVVNHDLLPFPPELLGNMAAGLITFTPALYVESRPEIQTEGYLQQYRDLSGLGAELQRVIESQALASV